MLPDMNGYQVCETIRGRDPILPILMLTARGQEADKIRGLEAGADDYMTKPFSIGELVARLTGALSAEPGALGSARPPPRSRSATSTWKQALRRSPAGAETTHHLSFYEVELLKFLWEREGEPVSRATRSSRRSGASRQARTTVRSTTSS